MLYKYFKEGKKLLKDIKVDLNKLNQIKYTVFLGS